MVVSGTCFLKKLLSRVSYLLLCLLHITPKFSVLRSQHLLSHSFCGTGIWAQLSWVLWLRASQGLPSPEGLTGDLLPSSPMWLLAGCSPPWIVGFTSSLADGLRVAPVACHVGLSSTVAPFIDVYSGEGGRRRMSARGKARSLTTKAWE